MENKLLRGAGWCALAAVMLAFCWVTSAPLGPAGGTDFRAFYAAGKIVRTAPERLYDAGLQAQVEERATGPRLYALPFYHPAYEALLYAPFSLVGFRLAYVLYALLNLVLLALVVLYAPEAVDARVRGWRRAWLLLTFLPVLLAVVQGQNSILQVLLCCWSLRRMRVGDEAGAGALLAAGMFRPQIAVPIAVLLGARAGWKFAAGFVGVCVAEAALCVALVGRSGMAAWWRLLRPVTMVQDQSHGSQVALGIMPSSMPNVRGLLAVCGAGRLPAMWAAGVTVGVSLAVLATGWWVMRRMGSLEGRFGVAVVCAVLVSYHLNSHDAALLLLPMLLLSGPGQAVLVGAGWALPYLLYGVSGARDFAWMAVVPVAMLWSAEREAGSEGSGVAGRGEELGVSS